MLRDIDKTVKRCYIPAIMQIDQLLQAIWNRKIRFICVFFVIFTIMYAILYFVDFLPESISGDSDKSAVELTDHEREIMTDETDRLQTVSEQELNVEIIDEVDAAPIDSSVPQARLLPDSIYIEKLDKTVEVLNPNSRMIADLDGALLDGVVRHPDSATLDQEGNVFILGHSSYLPNVLNKNFQAFNGIQNLDWGDTIEVSSGEKTFVYRVEKVYKAKASEVTVPIADTGSMLTIATCNSFGSTDDRYIVEASLLKTTDA